MSYWDEPSEDRWARQREEERRYESDVFYDAWRRGMDPDRAVECAHDCYREGVSPEQCVDATAQKIADARYRQQCEEAEAAALYEQARQEQESEQP